MADDAKRSFLDKMRGLARRDHEPPAASLDDSDRRVQQDRPSKGIPEAVREQAAQAATPADYAPASTNEGDLGQLASPITPNPSVSDTTQPRLREETIERIRSVEAQPELE